MRCRRARSGWRSLGRAARRGSARRRAGRAANRESRPADTRAYEVQPPPAPAAVLAEQRPDGHGRRVVLDGGLLTIGRAPDNDLVLDDQRVSRHHARLQARRGMLVLTDLDSANGSRVNGVAISEVALGAGDRIEMGDHDLHGRSRLAWLMDPYVVAIWIVRIAFLGGLYLFMFGVARLLLRDLRAATRDPGRRRWPGWSSSARRWPSRPGARSSASTPSPRSGGT